jgi:hypothetical protein
MDIAQEEAAAKKLAKKAKRSKDKRVVIQGAYLFGDSREDEPEVRPPCPEGSSEQG